MVGYGARHHIRRNALQHLHQEITMTKKKGSFSLEDSLVTLVRNGHIDREDALVCAIHPDDLDILLSSRLSRCRPRLPSKRTDSFFAPQPRERAPQIVRLLALLAHLAAKLAEIGCSASKLDKLLQIGRRALVSQLRCRPRSRIARCAVSGFPITAPDASCGATAHRASAATPSPPFTISMMASVNITSWTWRGQTPAGARISFNSVLSSFGG